MKVIAKDTMGNEFPKEVKTLTGSGFHEGMMIIDFGWPVQYVADSLMEHYPFDRPMCIDMGGLNHKGFKVTISAEQMNQVMEHFVIRDSHD